MNGTLSATEPVLRCPNTGIVPMSANANVAGPSACPRPYGEGGVKREGGARKVCIQGMLIQVCRATRSQLAMEALTYGSRAVRE